MTHHHQLSHHAFMILILCVAAATSFDDGPICRWAFSRLNDGLSVCGLKHQGVTFRCHGSYWDGSELIAIHEAMKGRFSQNSAAAVMAACVTPCMMNVNNRCCEVPAVIASLFPCCRQLHCSCLGKIACNARVRMFGAHTATLRGGR